jgi:16S rRNA (cytosine967-C5)-methyltransferase
MKPEARLSAAIAILSEIHTQRRPASDSLTEWGRRSRFAGAKDRASIAGLVYDALRCQASAALQMEDESPRAIVLGMLRQTRGLKVNEISALTTGEGYAPSPLTQKERTHLDQDPLSLQGPLAALTNIPEWMLPSFSRVFPNPEHLFSEGRALTHRAPLDLRVNTLKTSRDALLKELAHYHPLSTPHSPWGIRIIPSIDSPPPSVQSEQVFIKKGHFEIQDEGSQLTVLLSPIQPGMQVIDLCAGAGGKTLALAALMENKGQIYATDVAPQRLSAIYNRLTRSGVRNTQVRAPKGRFTDPNVPDPLADLKDKKVDAVFIDAPCTGTGTWRRNPDAKWRLTSSSLRMRHNEQASILDRATQYIKPGGYIIYVTCSFLMEENEDIIHAFLDRHPSFTPFHTSKIHNFPLYHHNYGVLLSPGKTGTDGFYFCVLRQKTE